MSRPRVLLGEDHRLLREAFMRLIEPECEVVGGVGDGRAVVAEASKLQPDIVVMGVEMPLLNGLDAARLLHKEMPKIKVIFVTQHEDPEIAAEAFRAGAAGFLLKKSSANELITAIKEVARGRSYVTPLATKWLVNSLLRPPVTPARGVVLSPRQREVLQLLAEGHTMKEIGRQLQITARTVAFHKYTMMDQLGVTTNADLFRTAIKHHLIAA